MTDAIEIYVEEQYDGHQYGLRICHPEIVRILAEDSDRIWSCMSPIERKMAQWLCWLRHHGRSMEDAYRAVTCGITPPEDEFIHPWE